MCCQTFSEQNQNLHHLHLQQTFKVIREEPQILGLVISRKPEPEPFDLSLPAVISQEIGGEILSQYQRRDRNIQFPLRPCSDSERVSCILREKNDCKIESEGFK